MGNTKDCWPIIGALQSRPNVIVAVGCNGYGMSLSQGVSGAVLSIINGSGTYDEIDLFTPRRFNI